MSKGLDALKELRENGAVSFSKATISFTYLAFVQRADIIEKELKALKVIVKTLDIRVSMNKGGQCFLEDNHCIYAIPRSTYDLLKGVLL